MNWIKKILGLKAKKHCIAHSIAHNAYSGKKANPYELIFYKRGWSKTRVEKNNVKYWEFEIEHNGLTLP